MHVSSARARLLATSLLLAAPLAPACGDDDAGGTLGSESASASETDASTTATTSDPGATASDAGDGDGDGDGWLSECPNVVPTGALGIVTDSEINEASGLAASRSQPGVVWVHNDSGDAPRLFALSDAAVVVGEYSLDGALALDWEDMAIGPGPTPGDWLYVGDIGDNAEARPWITVYRVPEPTVQGAGGEPVALSGVEAIELQYPDTPHNAETLLVDPISGDLLIVTKGEETRLFQLPAPLAAGGPYTLVEVPALSFPSAVATGGDVSPLGDFVIVRTYSDAYLWLRAQGGALADALA
ncbi:MAG: hypothetical protein KC468_24785, partial [Myxococcales bacterium]|nr:hypothetical protein [Myxococcales bacterium]